MKHNRHQRQAFGRVQHKQRKSIKLICPVEIPLSQKNLCGSLLSKIKKSETNIQLLPLKHLRLQELADSGFNCPDFRFWLRGTLNIAELREFLKIHKKISLRNFTEENVLAETPKLPVAYGKNDWNFIEEFCGRNNTQYHTLVNQFLPPDESLLAGNIILLDDTRYAVSCFEGPGTPRDVDDKVSELKVCQRKFNEPPPKWVPETLKNLVSKLKTFRPDFRPMTIEFSIYPYAVGMLSRPEILWEWRGGSAHDLYTVISRLLENADSHELTLALLASNKT